jgi:glycosyltransferase involved in cell wall biosynthesis
MQRTILSVAYPLTRVDPDAVGGCEQILAQLDAALVRAGQRSIVVAAENSRVAGELVPTPTWHGRITGEVRRWGQMQHRIAIAEAIRRFQPDLIHTHGLDWDTYLPAAGTPVLATLHLPCEWYPGPVWRIDRPSTYLNCVSHSQRARCRAALPIFVVENGVPLDQLHCQVRKRNYALALGRVCPEKGMHLAVDAAKLAGMPVLLAGEVFQYPEHLAYFEAEIAPRLDARTRFLGPIGFERKRRLLTAAQCLLVHSLVDETSSLVAMESLACGTPVIALAKGALPEIIEHGRTGFIIHDVAGMAAAIRRVREIDPEECRRAARERFSAQRMFHDYLALYEHILFRERSRRSRTHPQSSRVEPGPYSG